MTTQSDTAASHLSLPKSLGEALQLCREMVFILDRHARVLFVNRQFLRVTGCSGQDILGQDLRSCAYGRHFFESDPAALQAVDSGGIWRGEVRGVNAKGQEIWGRAVFAPVREDGAAHAVTVVVVEDITDDKLAMNAIAPDAFGDPLLGVPFIVFMDRLHQALRRSARDAKQVGLVCLEFAPPAGPAGEVVLDRQVCQTILASICKCLRRLDTAVRLDDAEFAIILEDLMRSGNVHLVLQRILESLGRLRQDYGAPLPRVFMGVAVYPEHGGDCDTLFDSARKALAEAKKREDIPYVLA